MERAELRHGDVLLFERGSKHGTLLGRLIRLFTGSRYTHSAIVVENLNKQKFIVEQDGRVKVTPINDYVFKRPEKVHAFRTDSLRWNNSLSMLVAWSMVGTKYGVANLFEILFQHLMGRLYPKWTPVPVFLQNDRRKCTGSGLVAKIMFVSTIGEVGEMDYLRYSTIVEPDDFSENRGFVDVGIIHNGD